MQCESIEVNVLGIRKAVEFVTDKKGSGALLPELPATHLRSVPGFPQKAPDPNGTVAYEIRLLSAYLHLTLVGQFV